MSKTFEDEMDKLRDYLQVTTSNAIKTQLISTLHWFRAGGESGGAAVAAPPDSPFQTSVRKYYAHYGKFATKLYTNEKKVIITKNDMKNSTIR